MRAAAFTLTAATVAAAGTATLSIERRDGWHEWWRADRAPSQWTAALSAVTDAVEWHTVRPGLEWGSLRLSGSGEAWRIRAIVVRMDPARLRFRLVTPPGRLGPPNRWTVDEIPAGATMAFNAGQFGMRGPWGWLVQKGVERQEPGSGPLAPAVVVEQSGRMRIVPPDSIATVRASGGVAEAFQSYPMLLAGDGSIPRPLLQDGSGVNLRHRDARLALGELRDGRILLVLTRFEGLGGVLENLPFGLTTPEMAALMGALGSRTAVLLDGGISSQLLLRDSAGTAARWSGLRNVPLGMIAEAR